MNGVSKTRSREFGALIYLISDIDALRRVQADESLPKPVRLAAHVVSLRAGVDIGDHGAAILSLWTPDALPWFLPSLAASLQKAGVEAAISKRLVSAVLRATRCEYDTRELLDPLLERWRETSSAPITSANVIERWLRL
jgi:hypothetical protein